MAREIFRAAVPSKAMLCRPNLFTWIELRIGLVSLGSKFIERSHRPSGVLGGVRPSSSSRQCTLPTSVVVWVHIGRTRDQEGNGAERELRGSSFLMRFYCCTK